MHPQVAAQTALQTGSSQRAGLGSLAGTGAGPDKLVLLLLTCHLINNKLWMHHFQSLIEMLQYKIKV